MGQLLSPSIPAISTLEASGSSWSMAVRYRRRHEILQELQEYGRPSQGGTLSMVYLTPTALSEFVTSISWTSSTTMMRRMYLASASFPSAADTPLPWLCWPPHPWKAEWYQCDNLGKALQVGTWS